MRKKLAIVLLLAMTYASFGGIAQAEAPMTPAEHRKLFREGAELWPIYCNQCHNARKGGGGGGGGGGGRGAGGGGEGGGGPGGEGGGGGGWVGGGGRLYKFIADAGFVISRR